LRDLLPGCLLVSPQGEVMLIDLYRLGLYPDSGPDATVGPLRPLRRFPAPERAAPLDEYGIELLDPGLWGIGFLSSFLQAEETRVSQRGRFITLRFSGLRDGLPADAFLLLDSKANPSSASRAAVRAIAWPVDLDDPGPALAVSDD